MCQQVALLFLRPLWAAYWGRSSFAAVQWPDMWHCRLQGPSKQGQGEVMQASAYPSLNRSPELPPASPLFRLDDQGTAGQLLRVFNLELQRPKSVAEKTVRPPPNFWAHFSRVFTRFSQAISGRKLVLCCSILLLLNYLFHDYLRNFIWKNAWRRK